MKKVKLIVTFIGYGRYLYEEFYGIKQYHTDTIKEALTKILEVHGYGLPTDENDEPVITTIEEMLEELNSNNGDGCDYVMSIIDGNTGQIVYCCDEAPDSYPIVG